ncbi:MAG: PilZ domain-containing protein [Terriglobia bacterium]
MVPIDYERRGQPRIKPAKAIFVEYPGYQAQIRDLSLGGAFIEDHRPIARGRVVQMRLLLDGGTPIVAKAIVRRVEPDIGMGVEFIEMTADDRNRLREFVGDTGKIERIQSF